MPEKGDITDWVSAYPHLSTNELVEELERAIALEIGKTGKRKPNYTISYINGITALLKLDLTVRRWNEVEGVLPLFNGVLDLKTRKLLPIAQKTN